MNAIPQSINRRLLHWLKLWDFVVFGKDVPKKNKNTNKGKENDSKKFKKFQAEVEENLDQFNRPQQPVIHQLIHEITKQPIHDQLIMLQYLPFISL